MMTMMIQRERLMTCLQLRDVAHVVWSQQRKHVHIGRPGTFHILAL